MGIWQAMILTLEAIQSSQPGWRWSQAGIREVGKCYCLFQTYDLAFMNNGHYPGSSEGRESRAEDYRPMIVFRISSSSKGSRLSSRPWRSSVRFPGSRHGLE